MSLTVPVGRTSSTSEGDRLMAGLEQISHAHDATAIGQHLGELRAWLATDLAAVEADLLVFDPRETPALSSARHLLQRSGKRLRPLCVLLASSMSGERPGDAARDLAVAAELVHNATLLHDDVVDVGDARRGAPTARVIYGNAASIYGGDWLLVEAMKRIRRARVDDVLDRALDVLAEMILAESAQLRRRGRVDGSADEYFRVAEGKTASLFGWALYAGARAGGGDGTVCASLERFGRKMGLAFQVIDDVLDVAGDPDVVGKSLLRDVREGKVTYPWLLAIQRQPALARIVEAACAPNGAPLDPEAEARAVHAVRESGAVADAMETARRISDEALEALASVPACRARDGLHDMARALLSRDK